MRLSESIAHVRTHLAAWWPLKSRAREMARQYKAMAETCPLAVADMLRYGLLFDDVHAPGDRDHTYINIGRRQFALHLAAMIELTPEDLQHLREETEDDGTRDA